MAEERITATGGVGMKPPRELAVATAADEPFGRWLPLVGAVIVAASFGLYLWRHRS